MLEHLCIDMNDTSDVIVPLPNVSSDVLRLIIEFCEYHKDDPAPPIAVDGDEDIRTDNISPWDADFLQVMS